MEKPEKPKKIKRSSKFKKPLLAAGLFLLTVIIINVGLYIISPSAESGKKPDMFQVIAVSLIITWIIFLVGYYVWAIMFYNINLGWTDEDWAGKSGKTHLLSSDDPDEKIDASAITSVNPSTKEPDGNPNAGESLGLPTGTVRATIALSLLVAGLSTTIASFSMNNTYPLNTLFIDNFEFFKTGFLMMIAFYFGAKSLDILRKTNNAAIVTKGADKTADKSDAASGETDDNAKPELSDETSADPKKIFDNPAARG